jgi:hypothetical protein
VLVSGPAGSIAAGASFDLVVAAEDPFGNVDPTYSGTEALFLASNPGGATLGGTTTAAASGGMATFSGLTLDRGGDAYTLQVTGPGLAAAVTGPMTVTSSMDVIAPPVTILGASLQPEAAGKHKTTMVIVVQFSDALSSAAADNLGAYSLTTMAQGKKHLSKPVALVQASYNTAAHTVTLTPQKKLVLSPPLELQVSGSALTDTLGRPVDGAAGGPPGSAFRATLSKGGVSIQSALQTAGTTGRGPNLSPHHVDRVLEAGFRLRGRHGRG